MADTGNVSLPRTSMSDLEHVYVARRDKAVLHDVNLRIGPGEHLAILGPNGCGKSTLLKTLTCELYPLPRPETRLRIFGRERWDVAELRRRMGVVSAEPPAKTALHTAGFDAILTGFFGGTALWPHLHVTPAMRERAEHILALVDAQPLRHKPLGSMSAGEQKRILIGRAMAGASEDGTGDVQMLLLDEPSNALDLAAQAGLRDTLRRLAEHGTAILMITHHVGDVLPEIGRVLLMRDGRIDADDAKSELLTESRLSDLFGRPVHLSERAGFHQAW